MDGWMDDLDLDLPGHRTLRSFLSQAHRTGAGDGYGHGKWQMYLKCVHGSELISGR